MYRNKKTYRAFELVTLLLLAVFTGCSDEPVIQPIAFNHQIHIEENDLECTTCHEQVMDNYKATIPTVHLCQDCHDEASTNSDLEKQVLDYTQNDEDIPWKRIYRVPDHVYFSHRRHVTIGKIKCEQCHGDVKKLSKPPEHPLVPISMENCMNCHKEHGITNDCLACHR